MFRHVLEDLKFRRCLEIGISMDIKNFKDLMPSYKDQPPHSYKYRFTVFTPVYNCEKTISKVHDCLKKQIFTDFEWLIINDASTDDSHSVIEKIISNSPLNIRYINNKENKHKMRCFIQSIDEADGEFLLTLDGDDECMPEALAFFDEEYRSVPDDMKANIGAVTVLCRDQFGKRVGNLFPESPFYCNTFEAEMTKKITGEKWGFTKTDVLRNIIIPPAMLEHGYIPESIIWNTVAMNGQITKCVNKILRIYYLDVEGSISSAPASQTAFGLVLNGIAKLNWFLKKYFFKSPVFFLKTLYVTIRSSRYFDYSLKAYLNSIDNGLVRLVFIILWPFRRFM